jgi:hypothetical protein
VAPVMSPAADDSLGAFLMKVMKEREVSVPELAKRLGGTDQRTIKRWRKSKSTILSRSARALTDALDADFSPFVRSYSTNNNHHDGASSDALAGEMAAVREALDEFRAALLDLADRVEALEKR